jgi:two-component system response regulator AtoC
MLRVLVIDDEENLRLMLSSLLKRHGYQVDTVPSAQKALEAFFQRTYNMALLDIRMPEMDGMELLKKMKEKNIQVTTIVMSAYGNIDLAIEAMKIGAYDYVSKPFKPDEIILALKKAEERERLKQENIALRKEIKKEHAFYNIISKNPIMHEIFRTIKKIAEYKSTVIIFGESGTGKELVARAIHAQSPRKKASFVAVNCGAIPANLLESELFGHKKGAFTDALTEKKGLFEEANHGTLLLDEIGELPPPLQIKLLRALQEGTIRRLGDTRDIKIDVRIVAATSRELAKDVSSGRFREDLFYRLNVVPIHLPPLRNRKEDIPLLVDHFITKNNIKLKTNIKGIDPEAMKILIQYNWPGNIRELENIIERAMVLAEEEILKPNDFPAELLTTKDYIQMTLSSDELSIKRTSRFIERVLIERALNKTKGNKILAAKLLEISHRALLYKIKEYEIQIKK